VRIPIFGRTGVLFNQLYMNQDPEVIYQLQQHNIKAFKALCHDYAEDMTILAYILLEDSDRANQVVNDLLLRLWSEEGFRDATSPLHTFLFQQVKKECETLTWGIHATK
jgi:DNA-directed RNA polymerase specialized sigma24 family protein